MTALSVSGLTGGYTKAPILRDVAITVGEGEIVALFGANGAGKTSLLRGLSGALPVCRGEITLGDRRIDKLPTWTRAQLGLAHVPEGRHIFGSLTVRENLEAGALAGRGGIAVDEVFELFPRLAERARQKAGTLSGGEQQMVAVGRGLMSGPTVMLIDEMSAGLAPVIVSRLMAAVRRLADTGLAVLLVEQFAALALSIGDRAYVMRRGRVVYDGDCPSLLRAPDELHRLYLGG